MYANIPFFLGLPPTSPSSHSSRSSQSTKLNFPGFRTCSHQLSILHMVVYMCNPNILIHPTFPSPMPTSTCLFSASGSLFLPWKQVHLYQKKQAIKLIIHLTVTVTLCSQKKNPYRATVQIILCSQKELLFHQNSLS